jgi:hypothetical protein
MTQTIDVRSTAKTINWTINILFELPLIRENSEFFFLVFSDTGT